jgi:membrane fusion protein, copper/silver efflux system
MRKYRLYIGVIVAAVGLLAACGQRGGARTPGNFEVKAMDSMKMGDSGMKGMAMDSVKTTRHAEPVWTCPMHPEIVRDKPGTCPICGMDLVRKEPEARKVAGVGFNDLLRAGNGEVLSSVPVATIHRKAVTKVLEVFGRIAYDTRRISTISARVSGRIEKLYVRYRYQHVQRGQRIMDLYSPELITGEQDLLFLLRNDPTNSVLIGAARERLQLLGVSAEDLAELERTGRPSATLAVYSNYTGHIHEAGNTMPGAEAGPGLSTGSEGSASLGSSGMPEALPVKEGMYVEKGQTVFQVFNMDRSWAELEVFPGDAGLVRKGDAVRVVPETAPEKAFAGRVDEVLPFYGKDEKALTARVYFDNIGHDIPIGSRLKAIIQPAPVKGDWLPAEAVLSLGTERVVFLRVATGFQAHKVVTGTIYKDQVQVLSGLNAEDSVAENAQFLTDSEDFVKVKE